MKVEEIRFRLEEIWRKIPEIECKMCGKCCGPHFWFYAEYLVIKDYLQKRGLKERFAKSLFDLCPYLDENKKCIIYEVRPTICRLFGVVEGLECPYVRAERYLTRKEAYEILSEVENLAKPPKPVLRNKVHFVRQLEGG